MKDLFCALFGYLLSIYLILSSFSTISAEVSTAGETFTHSMPQTAIPGVLLSFDYPDQVNAGGDFMLNIELKKEARYNTGGTIICTFFGGLTAKTTSLDMADYFVNDNTGTISWKEFTNSNIIQFSLPVSTQKDSRGVYPINIKYLDETGFKESTSLGIFIHNKQPKPRLSANIQEPTSPYSINLIYPNEVLFKSDFDLEIKLVKGKYTGGAEIHLQLPPDNTVEVMGSKDYQLDERKGNTLLRLSKMPASPEFSIQCKVRNSNDSKAVYPIRVSAKLDDGRVISEDNYIFITDEFALTRREQDELFKQQNKNRDSEITADTATMFAELDQLLKAWTESTKGVDPTAKTQTEAKPSSSEEKQESKQKEVLTSTTDEAQKTTVAATNPKPAPKKVTQPATDKKETNNEPVTEETTAYSNTSWFAVQIAGSKVKLPKLEQKLRAIEKNETLHEDYDGEIYRYAVGEFPKKEDADKMKKYLNKNGYPDAFVVRFDNGKRAKAYY